MKVSVASRRWLGRILVAVAIFGCTGADSGIGSLELRAVRYSTLPDSFFAIGATVASSGSLIIWADKSARLVLVDENNNRSVVVNPHLRKPIGALQERTQRFGEVIEVVDGGSRQLVLFSADGKLFQTRRIISDHLRSMDAAVATPRGWIVGGFGNSGLYEIDLLTTEDSAVRARVLHSVAGSEKDSAIIQVSASLEAIYLTRQASPFNIVRLSADGIVVFRSKPDTAVIRRFFGDANLKLWSSLPVVPLDKGLLQTLVDLTSDSRIMVLYDQKGKVVRSKALNAPVGFIASFPSKQLLVGARRTRNIELVTYRWRWVSN